MGSPGSIRSTILEQGVHLRRLFSTFADGWPGAALLVMRLVTGGVLASRAIAALNGTLPLGPTPTLIVQIALALLLLLGLWTPVAGTLVAVLQVWRLVEQQGDPWIHVLLATLGGALALLGPGAWSVDARLFGWKRLDIRPEPLEPPSRS